MSYDGTSIAHTETSEQWLHVPNRARRNEQMTSEHALTLSFAHGSADELTTGAQLLTLLRRHDLSRWRFTTDIHIDRQAIPHSHPTLTLHTRHLDDDGLLLATYLYEQLHWFVEGRQTGLQQAIAALQACYPHPPVGYPQGAR